MNIEFISNWKSQMKKGNLTFILLNLLKDNEMYGYEIIEKISKVISVNVAEGTVYPLLNKLKNENIVVSKWVEQNSGIPRKYYSLTESGEAILAEMKEFWNTLNKSINETIK